MKKAWILILLPILLLAGGRARADAPPSGFFALPASLLSNMGWSSQRDTIGYYWYREGNLGEPTLDPVSKIETFPFPDFRYKLGLYTGVAPYFPSGFQVGPDFDLIYWPINNAWFSQSKFTSYYPGVRVLALQQLNFDHSADGPLTVGVGPSIGSWDNLPFDFSPVFEWKTNDHWRWTLAFYFNANLKVLWDLFGSALHLESAGTKKDYSPSN